MRTYLKENKIIIILFFINILCLSSCETKEKLIHNDVLDTNANWIVEQQPKGTTTVEDGKMTVIDVKGFTAWFKHKLVGNIKIEYDITIIDNNGPYDRVSDMNCFWMANDPKNPDDFFKESKIRAGLFLNYHHLTQYYVGYGGHNNTKTRFRRYDGNIDRPLLPKHDLTDEEFMITANKKMHIKIVVKDNYTSYTRDGKVIFEMNDPEPYTSGYFGFRTVNNHMEIENFRITQLE
ncbi:DUF6250 domain-containing protein [Mariniflexile ostreae]|uniref:DUF6250 domain-containing protein n=1 Tax=Mariniflexile ostreae TaxID=1520892 RepID=A0ABV5FFH6_9FLAO